MKEILVSRTDRVVITLLRKDKRKRLWPLHLSLISSQLERVYILVAAWFRRAKNGAGIRRRSLIERCAADNSTRYYRSIKSRCWRLASGGNLYRGRPRATASIPSSSLPDTSAPKLDIYFPRLDFPMGLQSRPIRIPLVVALSTCKLSEWTPSRFGVSLIIRPSEITDAKSIFQPPFQPSISRSRDDDCSPQTRTKDTCTRLRENIARLFAKLVLFQERNCYYYYYKGEVFQTFPLLFISANPSEGSLLASSRN